jgi:hypothetical protein
MEDWDTDWKIPSTKTEQPEMWCLGIEEIPSVEEEEEGKGNNKGNIVSHLGDKRKDIGKGKLVPQRKKRKVVKE